MTINSKLGELIHLKEAAQAKNARFEESLNQDSNKKREQVWYLNGFYQTVKAPENFIAKAHLILK